MNVLLHFLVGLFDRLTSACKWGFIFLSMVKLIILGEGETATSILLILTILCAILVTILKLFAIILVNLSHKT